MSPLSSRFTHADKSAAESKSANVQEEEFTMITWFYNSLLAPEPDAMTINRQKEEILG